MPSEIENMALEYDTTNSVNSRLQCKCDRCTQLCYYKFIIIIFMSWYFIPRVLKLARVKMYVGNGHDGDSETVNVLARHTALKRCSELPLKYVGSWYRNVVSRGSAVQSVALFCRFLRRGCEPRLIIIEPYYYYFKAYPANSQACTPISSSSSVHYYYLIYLLTR